MINTQNIDANIYTDDLLNINLLEQEGCLGAIIISILETCLRMSMR